ncbi:MAG: VWA domain-containing protein [Candidatus Thorarchaeota archaeon]
MEKCPWDGKLCDLGCKGYKEKIISLLKNNNYRGNMISPGGREFIFDKFTIYVGDMCTKNDYERLKKELNLHKEINMKNYTDVTMILDRSGSMESFKQDVIGGFNNFVKEQQRDKEKMTLSLIQFDDKYEEVYISEDINNVQLLSDETYVPRGLTSLRDTIGRTISSLGERLKNMDESERPEKVIVMIQTDGFENSSKEYNQKQIKEMIQHQEEKYNWKFIFLGAGLDVAAQSINIGININNTLAFGNNSNGYDAMYSSISRSVSNLKKMDVNSYNSSVVFSDKDKEDVEETLRDERS